MDLTTFAFHLLAGATVLAVGFALFSFGWIGGGDAKFAAAIALWLGWSNTLEFVATSAIFGGILTLAILTFQTQDAAGLRASPTVAVPPSRPERRRALWRRSRRCGA